MRSLRKAARNVAVFQCPCGTLATSLRPAVEAGHVGLGPGLIDEDHPRGIDALLMLGAADLIEASRFLYGRFRDSLPRGGDLRCRKCQRRRDFRPVARVRAAASEARPHGAVASDRCGAVVDAGSGCLAGGSGLIVLCDCDGRVRAWAGGFVLLWFPQLCGGLPIV